MALLRRSTSSRRKFADVLIDFFGRYLKFIGEIKWIQPERRTIPTREEEFPVPGDSSAAGNGFPYGWVYGAR
jgi:hypothetical protein